MADNDAQRKRKAAVIEDDNDGHDDAEDYKEEEKPKKKAPKAKKPAEPSVPGQAPAKKSAPKKSKALTPEEEAIAKLASVERNAAIVAYIASVEQHYKNVTKEFFKAANAKKARTAIEAVKEPIKNARDLADLPGVGKSTVEKIHQFLLENSGAGGTAAGAFGTMHAQPAKGSAEDWSWLAEGVSDREIVIGMLQRGEIDLATVQKYRSDIGQGEY